MNGVVLNTGVFHSDLATPEGYVVVLQAVEQLLFFKQSFL